MIAAWNRLITAEGALEARLALLGAERQELASQAWTDEALATSAIEGEQIDLLAVRSSVLRRLGVHPSPAASRDLAELADKGLLKQVGAGRSTRYYINRPGWYPA